MTKLFDKLCDFIDDVGGFINFVLILIIASILAYALLIIIGCVIAILLK